MSARVNGYPIHPGPKRRFVVGIDPGVTTGVAVWDRDERTFFATFSGDFVQAKHFIVDNYDPEIAEVIVEDPSLNKPTFGGGYHGGVDEGEVAKREKISRNVGMNQREAKLWVMTLEDRGYDVRTSRPSGPKWSAQHVKRLTGYDGRPNNQNVRDAIRLVWGF